jgi:hypothetical protein
MTEDILIPKLKARLIGWKTPIKWPNEVFPKKDGQEYIRVEIFPADASFSGIGTLKEKSSGFIRVTVFVPRFTGSSRAGELAGAALDLLKGWGDGGLQCYAGKVYPGPQQPIRLQRNVDVKYKYNQCFEVL